MGRGQRVEGWVRSLEFDLDYSDQFYMEFDKGNKCCWNRDAILLFFWRNGEAKVHWVRF